MNAFVVLFKSVAYSDFGVCALGYGTSPSTKRRLTSREGPWGKTKHCLVVHANVAATYTDLEPL